MKNYSRQHYLFNGQRVSYVDQGSGPAIVLVHGLGASIDYWQWHIDAWCTDYRVIAVDLPGFGQSDIPTIDKNQLTLHTSVELMKSLINHLNLHQPILVGHSLGAGILLDYARCYPEDYDRLVIISSMGMGREIDFVSKLLTIRGLGRILFQPTRYFIRGIFNKSATISHLEEIINSTLASYRRPLSRRWHLAVMRTGINLAGQKMVFSDDAFANLTRPILIIWGGKDQVFPVVHANRAKQIIPNAELHIIAEGKHNSHIEFLDEFLSVTKHFFTEETPSLSNQGEGKT